MTRQEREIQELRIANGLMERQIASLRREVREWTDLLDTIASPPWRRLWWWLQGYRLWRVGRWR